MQNVEVEADVKISNIKPQNFHVKISNVKPKNVKCRSRKTL
jgi:hypothetical protein